MRDFEGPGQGSSRQSTVAKRSMVAPLARSMDFLAKAETFVRIVESGSFSAAGRSLGLSLAAISRQVAVLEAELGAKLLLRTTRSLNLTAQGRSFHEHATRLLREADA